MLPEWKCADLFLRFTRWHITPRGAAFFRAYGQPHERLCSLPVSVLFRVGGASGFLGYFIHFIFHLKRVRRCAAFSVEHVAEGAQGGGNAPAMPRHRNPAGVGV